jgi:sugar phosphate isomerase/epimerase
MIYGAGVHFGFRRMPTFNRRKFLIAAAVGSASVGATERGMQLHLSCGALGIKATQREAIDYAAKFGFDVVDADGRFLAGLSESDLAQLRDLMASKKIGWAMAGLPVDFRRDEAAFSDTLKMFPAYAQALLRAGVRRVTTWLSPASAQHTYRVNFRQHAQRLREIARVLNDSNIRLGIEYVAPKTSWTTQRFPFIHTMAELKELMAEMNQPNIGFVLDSWHWYTAGESKDDLLTLRGKDVVSVDLNDAPSGIPVDQQMDGKRELPAATGVIDAKSFLGALEKIGYDGPVRAEPFNDAVRHMAPEQALSATMAALKKAFAS